MSTITYAELSDHIMTEVQETDEWNEVELFFNQVINKNIDITVEELVSSLGPYASVIIGHYSSLENRKFDNLSNALRKFAEYMAKDKSIEDGLETRRLQRLDALYMMEYAFGQDVLNDNLNKLVNMIHQLSDAILPNKYEATLKYIFFYTMEAEKTKIEKKNLGLAELKISEHYDHSLGIQTNGFVNHIAQGITPPGTIRSDWATISGNFLKEPLNNYEPGSVFPYLQELKSQPSRNS